MGAEYNHPESMFQLISAVVQFTHTAEQIQSDRVHNRANLLLR